MRRLILERLENTTRRGCVGLTCVELGIRKKPRGVVWPPLNYCFNDQEKAKERLKEMIANKTCKGKNCNGDPAKPRLFSVHFHNSTNKKGAKVEVRTDPKTGKMDFSEWDRIPKPDETKDNEFINFDYGYLNDDGKMIHANQSDYPGGSMKVYVSTIEEWRESYSDFNDEAWCVACEKREILE